MKPGVLVAGVVAVGVGLAVVLWAAMRDGAGGASPPAAPRDPVATVAGVDAGARRVASGSLPAVPRDPSVPFTASGGDGGPGVREFYDADRDRLVRDHRGSGEKATPSPITTETVGAVRVAAMPRVQACAAKRAPGGTAKRMTAVVRLKSIGGKVSISGTKAQVEGGAEPELAACVEAALNDMVIDAPEGQSDMTYRLALPFDL